MQDHYFRPAWWCPGGHLQTLWAPLLRRGPRLALRWERLELPDGDFVDLCWTGAGSGPIVVVLHGLEGSVRSPYARGILAAIDRCGWRGCFLHFRGCSGERNRLPRRYHSGDTGDIATLIRVLQRRHPKLPLAAVGFSLGGNALLKWLGEVGGDVPLRAAVAVSVPYDLSRVADRLEQGFSRVYQRHLLHRLQRRYREKFLHMDGAPYPVERVGELDSFRRFDHHVTAPLHGFAGVDDYYGRCSSRQFLGGIRVPTLLLHARNDPFMTPEAAPEPHELAPSVRLELTDRGGHVGFVEGRWPWRPHYWLERRIPCFLQEYLGGGTAYAPRP